MDRLVVQFTGASIGSGVAVHYADSAATGGQPALKALWNTLRTYMFSGVSIYVPSSGDQLDSATGAIIGAWSGGSPGVFAGSGAGSTYAAGVGMGIRWNTGTLVGGKRVRGRTYIVPLSPGNFDTDGTIYNATVSGVYTAANTAITSTTGNLLIWHRPVAGAGGVAAPITAAAVADKISWLKSRR